MKTFAKINDVRYPLIGNARENTRDSGWSGRHSIAMRLNMSYEEAAALFTDDMDWALVEQQDSYTLADKDGKPVTVTPDPVETDKSEFCLAGSITDNRDGTVTVKMGRLLDAEVLAIILGRNKE